MVGNHGGSCGGDGSSCVLAVEYREGKEESAGQRNNDTTNSASSVSSTPINPPTDSSGYSKRKGKRKAMTKDESEDCVGLFLDYLG